jgi:REP element-mobilizing transposase RayT
MMRKGSHNAEEFFGAQHRFEHWYRDNTVYFITARCRGRTNAFTSETCKAIFWDCFDRYTAKCGFVPFVTSLLSNHYHTLGYLKVGLNLASMMKGIHGSVAKLVNDRLPQRLSPFWVDAGHQNYFDGCIRDELQCRRAYRYVLTQCKRHGVCEHPKDYAHTRVAIELERAVARAVELKAFMTRVPYKRYGQR